MRRSLGAMVGRFLFLVAVVLVAVVAALPSGVGAPIPSLGPVSSDSSIRSVIGVPAALLAPWADRAGFDPVALANARTVVPAASEPVTVVVALRPTDPAFFSPVIGAPPLSSNQIRERFAPDDTALLAYFESRGLTIVHAWPDGLTLTLTGSATNVGAAFGTTLLDGTLSGRPIRMAASVPTLPAPLEAEVAAVSGLSSGVTQFVSTLSPAPLTPIAGRTSTLVSPTAVHQIYGLDDLYNYSGSPHLATGVGIALVLWGQGYVPSDISTFFSNNYPSEFPAPRVNYVPVDGAPPPSANAASDPSNVTSEMTLDLEWSGSTAPGATLSAVYAPDGPASNNYSPTDPHLEDAINTAVQGLSGINVISMSFGTADGSDAPFQAVVETELADAQQRGITVLAASGDTGGTARTGCQGGLNPEYPAASQYVIAVGGTAPVLDLSTLGSVTGLNSEPAWNRSGGGFSIDYAAPSWQEVGSAAASIRANGHRGMPDVAGPAADNLFFYNGQPQAGAGTSFASPLWAGIIAEMDAIRGAPLGFITPRLYAVGVAEANRTTGAGLVDITQGGNCLGPASAGWDTATGWGSPRGLLLYEDLSGTFVSVALAPSGASVVPGATFDASVVVTNVTSHGGIVGANVTFTLTSAKYLGPCGVALSAVASPTDRAGMAQITFTVPSCFLGSSLQLAATVSGGGYFGSNSTTVTVNLIGLAGFLAVIQVFPYNIIGFAGIMLVAVLIGWRVGTWRDRAARRRARPAKGTVPPPGAVGGTSRGPAPPPAIPPVGGPAASSTSTALTPPAATAAFSVPTPENPIQGAGPPGTAAPPPVDPAAAASAPPSPELRRCPVCNTIAGPDERMCPSCGALVQPL